MTWGSAACLEPFEPFEPFEPQDCKSGRLRVAALEEFIGRCIKISYDQCYS